jgi:ferredoxin
MRVVIDRSLCGGNGGCMEAAPEVFLVVERAGNAQATLVQEAPAATLRAKLDAAVRGCPNGALKLVEGNAAESAAESDGQEAGPRGEFSASDLEGDGLFPDG